MVRLQITITACCLGQPNRPILSAKATVAMVTGGVVTFGREPSLGISLQCMFSGKIFRVFEKLGSVFRVLLSEISAQRVLGLRVLH